MATAKPSSNSSSREKLHRAYNLAGEAAAETAESLRQKARSSVEINKQRATDLEQKVEASIQSHPLLSVGCAFAVGWIVARLMK
ncbi:hypothetical protein [Microbulbifer sp. 2201CG32-9]|uniref:hypothetical protein n=1 Tax=unclassified Microbulbifer TaxID=2619833 RepID=UPI00345B87A1